MNIFIIFDKQKYSIKSIKYQSINSIINNLINNNNLNIDINDTFIDYNGIYLDKNLSLEKYNIIDDSILNLNVKIKGGYSGNLVIIILSCIIVLIPILILPTGIIPSLSILISTIIKRSIDSIGKYLVCNLGKKTLYNRILWFLVILKYAIYFFMVYVIFAFPITILCISVKGHTILDNPKSMCSPIKTSTTAGVALTALYMILYGFYRVGNTILEGIINISKKFYITDVLLNPILNMLLGLYNTFKYVPLYFIPIIGVIAKAYFVFLDYVLPTIKPILVTISQYGCKTTFSSSSFTNALKSNLKSSIPQFDSILKEGGNSQIHNEIKTEIIPDSFCEKDKIQCCNPRNFVLIADSLKSVIDNSFMKMIFDKFNVLPIFILVVQGLYEYALNNQYSSLNIPETVNDKTAFFKDLIKSNHDLSNETVDIIKKYLKTFDVNLITEIEQHIQSNISSDKDKMIEIKDNIQECEDRLYEYSKKNKTKYIPNSLINIILKYVFIHIVCNVLQTSHSSVEVIEDMYDIPNITDMLKAGSSTGIWMTFAYVLAVIIIVILGIFNYF